MRADLKRSLALVACLAVAVAAFELPVLKPLKLLAVMGHETGHAVASLLVGGKVNRVTVALNEGGECLSQTPATFVSRVIVYSAGYVGAAIASAVLLLLTFRFALGRVMLALACAWLVAMALFYGRDAFTLLFCGCMALFFGLGARWLPMQAVTIVNLFIASFTSVYAVFDLKDDLWRSSVRGMTDAQLLADVTLVPAVVWAALWSLASVAIVAMGAWYAVRGGTETRAPSAARPRRA